ncbi:MAG: carboxypeptidase M32 [Bdellovibrionota bacterium]
MSAYKTLESRWHQISNIGHALSILSWDEATMMPSGGGEARAKASAGLRFIRHEMIIQKDTNDLISKAKEQKDLNDWEISNLKLMEKNWRRAQCIPSDLVRRSSEASSRCEQAWRKQRAENNWKEHLPLLEEVLKTQLEAAKILSQNLELDPYDALLDQYEAGLKSSEIDVLFGELRSQLPSILDAAILKQSDFKIQEPKIMISPQKQEALGRHLMKLFLFDFEHGRLDVSHHPFCGGVPDDVRLTTRYDEKNFISAVMGVLHETGHARYEQNLPKAWRDQPVGDALGMSVHESQSLFIEMQICRSREFLKFLRPLLLKFFDLDSKDPTWSEENLYHLYNKIERGYIRVDADELTYPLHILLRYEIERDLIQGKLKLKDLPELWNEKMQSYLGLSTQENFKDGCMQDIHWPYGLFGYFPCYTLGAMMAAQWAEAIKEAIPNLSSQIESGSFEDLQNWLRKNIHEKGSLFSAPELVQQVTGKKLSSGSFIQHLKTRYL